jgi:hypothetical protein
MELGVVHVRVRRDDPHGGDCIVAACSGGMVAGSTKKHSLSWEECSATPRASSAKPSVLGKSATSMPTASMRMSWGDPPAAIAQGGDTGRRRCRLTVCHSGRRPPAGAVER